MTTRKTFVEDMQGMETILCKLEDRTVDPGMTERDVIRAICRTLWHILTWIIKRIDEERREKDGRGN